MLILSIGYVLVMLGTGRQYSLGMLVNGKQGEALVVAERDSVAYQGTLFLGDLRLAGEAGVQRGDTLYTLTNTGPEPLTARFGIETNWGISGGEAAAGAYTVFAGGVLHRLNAIEATPAAKEVAVVKEKLGRALLRLSDAADWWQFPLETISLSEAGFERGYQGTTLVAHWPLGLGPGDVVKLKLQFTLLPSA